MALTCIYGGEPKPGAPAELNITSGFLCGLFGATHPLCRLFDLAIPTGGVTKSLLGALYKSIKNLRYLVAAGRALAIGEQGQVNTIDFCAEYPQVEIEDISYLDVVAALAPFGGDELYRKVAEITVVRLWNENCQCKAKGNQAGDGDPGQPIPELPLPDPSDICSTVFAAVNQQIQIANASRSTVLGALARDGGSYDIQVYDQGADTPDLTDGVPTFPIWGVPLPQPDSNGCICVYRRIKYCRIINFNGRLYTEDNVEIPPENWGWSLAFKTLKWCAPPTPPEIPDPVPVDDSPFLTDFCDIFPETQQCIQCAPPEHQEVDVPFNTACDQSGTITWGIDVVP